MGKAVNLSVLIPARNEMFLVNTIEDILKNKRGDTEIIAVCDGYRPDPHLARHPDVQVLYFPQSIGQRAAINRAASVSNAKYLLKADAHCAFDEGFDVKLIEPYETGELESNVTTVPRMYNLHVFDWECLGCQDRTYQGIKPEICQHCGDTRFEMRMVWQPRLSRMTDFARFDPNLRFQYWGSYKHRPEAQGDLPETMCFVGAAFMMPRTRFWELGGCDERHGGWGQQGVEESCKAMLSGGRLVTNRRTWFSHLFRTQPGFGFPYSLSGREVEKAREHSRWLWLGNNWEKAVLPFSYILDKFAPVPDWDEASLEAAHK